MHLILSGELPSGGWVDERQVIERLRVSRTPFREAIGILAKGGLVAAVGVANVGTSSSA